MTATLPPAEPSFIDTRRVGDAMVTVISEGGMLWSPRFPVPEAAWRRALPEADVEGRVWLGLNVFIIRLGEAVIVVDPGLDDPDSAWQRNRPRVWTDWPIARTAGLDVAMKALGILPEDVTHVVITHPHGDHYAGVCRERDGGFDIRFPNARHVMGRADWEGNPGRGDPASDLVRLEIIDQAGLLDLVDAERTIAPGVTVLPAPGESPGHCVVRVASTGETFYLLGDLVHLACEVEHLGWAPPNADQPTLSSVRERLFAEVAARDALLVTGHEPFPPWGRIVASGDGYRWQRC